MEALAKEVHCIFPLQCIPYLAVQLTLELLQLKHHTRKGQLYAQHEPPYRQRWLGPKFKGFSLTVRLTFNMIPLSVVVSEYSNESSTADMSGSAGKLLVTVSLGLLDPAAFTAVTWNL